MQVINFDNWDSQPYAEIGQTNPLRWMNLKPVSEDTYEPVSHWWMCKDFMNDAITAKWLKKKFSIYSFVCDPASFYSDEQKTMPMLLKGVLPAFMSNLTVVNQYLKKIKFPTIKASSYEDMVFIELPEKYLDNTLFMSTITLYIRLANTEKDYDSLDNMAGDPINRQDTTNYAATKAKPMEKMPEKYKPYIWSYGTSYNCAKDGSSSSFMTSTMHNCGVVNWSAF
jgi:hypothetical protein